MEAFHRVVINKEHVPREQICFLQNLFQVFDFGAPVDLARHEILEQEPPPEAGLPQLLHLALVILADDGDENAAPLEVSDRFSNSKRPAFHAVSTDVIHAFRGDAAPERVVDVKYDQLDHVDLADRAIETEQLRTRRFERFVKAHQEQLRGLVRLFQPVLVGLPVSVGETGAVVRNPDGVVLDEATSERGHHLIGVE